MLPPFDVDLTTSVDAGGTPDEFSFGILDGSGFNIPTSDVAGSFLYVDLNSTNPVVQTFSSISPSVPAPGISMNGHSPVPEPAVLPLMLGGGLPLLGILGRGRRSSPRAMARTH